MAEKTNAAKLVELAGGCRNLARGLGVNAAVVSRWDSSGPRGKRGRVPPEYSVPVLAYAKRHGFAAQARLLLDWECPTCGGKIKEM